jgi:predicted RNA-binding protein YlxR (DUF448 family)
MSPEKKARQKHIPQRVCVGCREVLAKRVLVRVVRRPDGVQLDFTGKVAGRGAYVHTRKACWENALRGPLAHALKTELSAADRETLAAYARSLPAEEPEASDPPRSGGGSA